MTGQFYRGLLDAKWMLMSEQQIKRCKSWSRSAPDTRMPLESFLDFCAGQITGTISEYYSSGLIQSSPAKI